jgi:hypothetical protein
MKGTERRAGILAMTCALLLGVACTSPPEPVNVENTVSMSATVDAVDHSTRMVSLRGENGRTATVKVTDEVRNLDQVQPGDKVVVKYYTALAAKLTKKGESETLGRVDSAIGAKVAEPGDRPGAAAGATVTTTVVIESIDQSFDTVTFKGPNGMSRTVAVETPEGKQFIDRLKKGDEVEVTYTEALAVSVEPAS